MYDALNYSPQPRILVGQKQSTGAQKSPFGLFIASFSLTFMMIFAFAVSSQENEPASSSVQSFSKNSKRLSKPANLKMKKYSA